MPEAELFLRVLDAYPGEEPKLERWTNDSRRLARKTIPVEVRPKRFPAPGDSFTLPTWDGHKGRVLKSILSSENETTVPGHSEWRRSMTIGDYAAALWLTSRNEVLGTVWRDGTLFHFAPLTRLDRQTGTILGVLVEVEQAKNPEELPVSQEKKSSETNLAAPGTEIVDCDSPIVRPTKPWQIEVLTAYTPCAVERIARCRVPGVTTLNHHLLKVQEETNWSFVNSNLPLRVLLKPFQITNFSETGLDPLTAWQRLVDGTQQPYKELHEKRGAADIIALVGCFAGAGRAGDGSRVPGDGLMVVDYADAIISLDFAHELGHILGADHPIEWLITTGTCAYARAYCTKTPAWYTIMGRNDCCEGTRSPFWSTAECLHSFPQGSAREDNVRAILKRAAQVAGYGDACRLGGGR